MACVAYLLNLRGGLLNEDQREDVEDDAKHEHAPQEGDKRPLNADKDRPQCPEPCDHLQRAQSLAELEDAHGAQGGRSAAPVGEPEIHVSADHQEEIERVETGILVPKEELAVQGQLQTQLHSVDNLEHDVEDIVDVDGAGFRVFIRRRDADLVVRRQAHFHAVAQDDDLDNPLEVARLHDLREDPGAFGLLPSPYVFDAIDEVRPHRAVVIS
mmetsp:Transcript_28198/g.78866  ORF Transcript_28198/g.78866 Transcript_28198/m.78866 type:complete len:213 (-) Transcript_28198:406-1044(-)